MDERYFKVSIDIILMRFIMIMCNNFSFSFKLFRSSITKHATHIFIYNSCFAHYKNSNALDTHKDECRKWISILPEDRKNIIKFENIQKQLDALFFNLCGLQMSPQQHE